MPKRVALGLCCLILTVAIWMNAAQVEAQITVDSGLVRELFLSVRSPGLPEWGMNQCFQIGDTVFSYALTDLFYMSTVPLVDRLQYCGIDSLMVQQLVRIADSLNDQSWDDIRIKYDSPIRIASLRSGLGVIDSNLSGRCIEYVAKYAVINEPLRCGHGGNIFEYIGNLRERHIIILRVDTLTAHECQFDKWILGRLVDNRRKLEVEVFHSK